MGAQNLHSAFVACPSCKRAGIIRWEPVAPNLWRGQRYRTVRALSKGFVTIDYNPQRDARIECASCKIPATEQSVSAEETPAAKQHQK